MINTTIEFKRGLGCSDIIPAGNHKISYRGDVNIRDEFGHFNPIINPSIVPTPILKRGLDYSDVLIIPSDNCKITSRSQVNIRNHFGMNPIIAANMDGVGTFDMASTLIEYGCMTALRKNYDIKDVINFFEQTPAAWSHVFFTIGVSDTDIQRLSRMIDFANNRPLNVCIDIANGHMDLLDEVTSKVRGMTDGIIMAGNVVSLFEAQQLKKYGADIVKIGIGPGAVCTTRVKTGIGVPQLTAVAGIAPFVNSCADGGVRHPADVSKAIVAGSQFVMLGSMLAGCVEGGAVNDGAGVEFYGMSSETANKKYNGGLRGYRSSEGRTVRIPFKGSVRPIISDILGGVRSAFSYTNSLDFDDFRNNSKLIEVHRTHNTELQEYTIK